MTGNYHHSVSNKLVLSYREGGLKWTICDRSFLPIRSGELPLVDDENIDGLLQNTLVLKNIFAAIHLLICNSGFTLIPNQLGKSDDREVVFKLNHELRLEEVIMGEALTASIENVFSIPAFLKKSIHKQYPTAEIHHESSVYFKWLNFEFKSRPHEIFVFHREGSLLLAVYKDDQLQLMNDYPIRTQDDIFYFVMASIEQLDMDPEKVTLHWTGTSNPNETIEAESIFKNYIRKIEIGTVTAPEHGQHDLPSQLFVKCEL